MVDMKKKATEILEDYSNSYSQVDLETLTKFLEQINAEAVKEFADKVLLYIPNIEGDTTIKCVEEAIKQTLKETVGDSK
jgi:hypothetical protein